MRKRYVFVATMMACVVAFGFALLFALLWQEHERVFALPVPTGPFAAGRAMDVWTAPAHADGLAPKREMPWEVIASIWYPAPNAAGDVRADDLPASWRAAVRGDARLRWCILGGLFETRGRVFFVGDAGTLSRCEYVNYPYNRGRDGASLCGRR